MMNVVPTEIRWNPDLSVFASEPFLRAVGDEYGWLGGYDDSGRLLCVLPYTIVRKAFFRMVRFRIETIPLIDPFPEEDEKQFLEEAVRYFRSSGGGVIIPASNNVIFRTYPNGAVAAPYGSYIVDLRQSEDILWGNLHSKHRNVIRNAIKKGVEIRSGGEEYLKIAHQLISSTLKRSNLGFMSSDALKHFVAGLGENIKIFIAYHEGIPQGCAVVPFSRYGAYYLYGGSIDNPLTGSMNLLQWEAMRQLGARGVMRYDFVGVRIDPEKGSKQEGLAMFKQRFGGTLVRGYMWKYPLRCISYGVYSLGVRALRGGDIVDQEKHKMNGLQSTGSHELDNRKVR